MRTENIRVYVKGIFHMRALERKLFAVFSSCECHTLCSVVLFENIRPRRQIFVAIKFETWNRETTEEKEKGEFSLRNSKRGGKKFDDNEVR